MAASPIPPPASHFPASVLCARPCQVEAGTDGGFLYSFLVVGQELLWGGLGHILGQVLTHSTSEPDAGTCTLRIRAAAGGSYGRSHRAAWCEGRAWPPGSGIPGTKDQCCGLLAVWHLGKFFKLQASVSPLENGNSASLMALLS